ncbi:N-formylglutamate amidohydrolase [Stappia indica]|uniref:N-formylglutamate amidohydrolase n=1 Tax=Stappia indica TaxID=538381 RepID=UPI001CD1DFFB|nr:N-formylglutamate amidohydrolase [Stappia indica]MCA1298382.1 N-formylglutamate amidohydrolase [Stappia indica]
MASAEDGAFTLRYPQGKVVPLLFDSPHSGTWYPEDFEPAQPPERYRRAEDMYVDELFAAAPGLGIPLMACRVGRSYCDVNRAADDLDPAAVREADGLSLAPGPKARLGKGVIWTATPPDGAPLLARPPTGAMVVARLARVWQPYHDGLSALFERVRRETGAAHVYHLDLHSMQPLANVMHEDAGGAPRPDIVLSDREGTSCAGDFIDATRAILLDLGFSVQINDPFRGAEILRRHGDPASGRHSLQIEVNRALYMDVETYRKTDGFASLCSRLEAFSARLRDWVAAR